jgi:phage shock protein PspC (stress-responsive transcriptional regulator)
MKKLISVILIICFSVVTIFGCGGYTPAPKEGESPKLARIKDTESIIGGVCTGLAYFTGTPVWLWRAGFVASVFIFGGGVILYIILWVFMPQYKSIPDDFHKRT